MTQAQRPEEVTLHCNHCGHQWLQAVRDLRSAQVVIYRDSENKSVERRVTCPKCSGGVIATVPRAWLDE